MVDPLVESHDNESPYTYAANNPVNFIDVGGLDTLSHKDLNMDTYNPESDVVELQGTTVTPKTNKPISYAEYQKEANKEFARQRQQQLDDFIYDMHQAQWRFVSHPITAYTVEVMFWGLGGVEGLFVVGGLVKKLVVRRLAASATKGTIKAITQFSGSTIDEAVTYAMRNKVTHVFGNAAHNLEPLVTKLGGQENTFRAVLNAANGKLPASGVFKNISVTVDNYNVVIRGSVINGIPKIGTMFIP